MLEFESVPDWSKKSDIEQFWGVVEGKKRVFFTAVGTASLKEFAAEHGLECIHDTRRRQYPACMFFFRPEHRRIAEQLYKVPLDASSLPKGELERLARQEGEWFDYSIEAVEEFLGGPNIV